MVTLNYNTVVIYDIITQSKPNKHNNSINFILNHFPNLNYLLYGLSPHLIIFYSTI